MNITECFLSMLGESGSELQTFHKKADVTQGTELFAARELKRFLAATMDEVRLYYAEIYAEQVLKVSFSGSWKHFRRAVLVREVSGAMAYEKQRDHAAHTVNNYLLGWYFFQESEPIKAQIEKQFQERLGEGKRWQQFGEVWCTASLLHDVGYLFEGNLSAQDFSHQSPNAAKGAEHATEFFRYHFWNSNQIRTRKQIDRVLELTGVDVPSFDGKSLSDIAMKLRTVKSFDNIRRTLAETYGDSMKKIDGDCFQIWKAWYSSANNKKMAERVDLLSKAEHILLTDGLPKLGIRVLDHGLAGAMLLVQAASLFFEIHAALPDQPPNKQDESILKAFKGVPNETNDVDVNWYWKGLLWATAAVAFHNIAQDKWEGVRGLSDLKIAIEDDVLTYLGILVDILEEWDRYTMTRDSILVGEASLPVQARDVEVTNDNGKVAFKYPTAKIADKVTKGLNDSLVGWDQLVTISSTS